MLRTVLAVFLGYVTLAVLVMAAFALALVAPNFAFQPDSLDVTPGWMAWAIAASVFAAAAGGAVAALIGRGRRAAYILAALVLAFGIGSAVMNAQKPAPTFTPEQLRAMSVMEMAEAVRQPQWYAMLLPLLGASGAALGAVMVKRS